MNARILPPFVEFDFSSISYFAAQPTINFDISTIIMIFVVVEF